MSNNFEGLTHRCEGSLKAEVSIRKTNYIRGSKRNNWDKEVWRLFYREYEFDYDCWLSNHVSEITYCPYCGEKLPTTDTDTPNIFVKGKTYKFSLKRFIEDCKSGGETDEDIEDHMAWVSKIKDIVVYGDGKHYTTVKTPRGSHMIVDAEWYTETD